MSRSRKRRRDRASNPAPIDANPPAPTTGADAPGRSKSSSFGPLLHRARTQRGLSLEAIARDTRLSSRYLLALENESIDALPGGVYNRAYLRTYAAYLGLDADGVVRDYDQQAQTQSAGTHLAAQSDAVAAMRAVAKQKEFQTAGRTVRVDAPRSRAVVLRSVAFVVVVGGVWAGTRHFADPAEVLPRPSSPPPAVAVSEALKPVVVSAAAPPPVPAAEPETLPAPVSDQPEVSKSVSVTDSGVGTGVINRQLVGRADAFAVGSRVVFWTLVSGGRRGDTVRHVWSREGRTIATVTLALGGASWRTQSQRTLAPGADGEWLVEAQDDAGRVLARHVFRALP